MFAAIDAEKVPLREAAIIAYEQLKGTPVGGVVSHLKSNAEDKIRHYCYTLNDYAQIYANFPPSRLSEKIDLKRNNREVIFDNGVTNAKALYSGTDTATHLHVNKDDLLKAIAAMKAKYEKL